MTELAIFKRNVLLLLAFLAAVLAFGTGLFGSVITFGDLWLLVFGGVVSSSLVLGLGCLFIQEPVDPWYSRKGAFWFLLPGLFVAAVGCVLIFDAAFDCTRRCNAVTMLCSILTVQLAFIAWADGPATEAPSDSTHRMEVRRFEQISTVRPSSNHQASKSPPCGEPCQLLHQGEKKCPARNHNAPPRP